MLEWLELTQNLSRWLIYYRWVIRFEFDTERSSKSVIVALLEEESFHTNMESTHAGAIKVVGPKDELSSHVPGQTKSPTARGLTPDEQRRLADERALVSDFKQLKLEREAQKNWDLFYKRNSTHFFKDRHWTTREFEELKACREVTRQDFSLFCLDRFSVMCLPIQTTCRALLLLVNYETLPEFN